MTIPRTFCLILPECPDIAEKARVYFETVGIKPEYFNGIHAEKFGLKTVNTYEVDNPGTNFNMGFKPTGIWISHFMLWSMLEWLPESHFWVLESDAKFPVNWGERMGNALEDVPPDFDILYNGSCCCDGRPKRHVKGDVYACSQVLCTHSYIVAKKALHTILMTQRKVYAPIDISLTFHSLPLLKSYVVLPRIVEQHNTVIPP